MPDSPSWIFADSTPGQSAGTNEAMPRFGGRANPGETIHMSIDGYDTAIAPTPDGTWTFTSAELGNGEHGFEMWTEDASGNKSDKVEWSNDVQSDPSDRAWQRERNRQWEQGGAGKFIDENDQLARQARQGTPPRPMTGGGGGGQQPMTDGPATGGGGTGSTTTGATTTSGSTGGSTAPGAAGFEKGNASQPAGHIG